MPWQTLSYGEIFEGYKGMIKVFLSWLIYAIYIIIMETIADKINNHLYRFLFRILIQVLPLGILLVLIYII